jgi:hypothetical protein
MKSKSSNVHLWSVGEVEGGREKKTKLPNLENLQKLRQEIDNREWALLV